MVQNSRAQLLSYFEWIRIQGPNCCHILNGSEFKDPIVGHILNVSEFQGPNCCHILNGSEFKGPIVGHSLNSSESKGPIVVIF